MNVADLLTHQAAATPDATAIIAEDHQLDFAALDALVWGLCRHLRDQGLHSGEVVGLHLQDTLLHLAAVLALARSGMVSVAVHAAGGDTEAARRVLARTAAAAVLDEGRGLDWGSLRRIALAPGHAFSLAAAVDDALRQTPSPDALLMFKTSSGTTGEPKIVGATHAGMIASIQREIEAIGYPPGERYMTPVPLRYDGPRRRTLACLAAGGTVVMAPREAGAAALLAAMERHRVGHFSCVTSQAFELAAAAGPGPQRLPWMRCFRLSAGPSDAPLHRLLRERLTSQVLVSYGCTELGPLTVAPPELVEREPQSVGRPMPGIEVQIVSPDDEPLPAGAVGLIRLRAEGMPHAYQDDDAATARSFRGGWFYPGDLGRLDAAGLLFHMGRADDMMVMDGVNIYPAEIEQALMAHPAVREAVAMPMRHQVVHEVPVAAVVLDPKAEVTQAQLLDFARERLGSHSPRALVVLERIPRNEHGKVQRPALSQAIAAQLAPAATGQLALPIAFGVQVPPQPDFARLDGWLRDVLALDVPPVAGASPQAVADAWLRRLLLLARALLQAARVPVFDAPRIVACRPDPARPHTWHANVAFALVEELPPAVYDIAIRAASNLAGWAAARPADDDQVQAFFSLIETHVIAPAARLWQIGKSTLPVLRAAHQASIPFTHLGGGVFQLGWGCKAQRLYKSVTGRDSAIAARLTTNKALTATLLRKAGLPAPVHRVTGDLSTAIQAARRIGWPIVVKPADLERGEGVSVDISDDERLGAAFEAARRLSPSRLVIVERQVPGVCHRLFIAHGRLLYAVKRLPMSVRGDGVSTVAALVEAEVARQRRLPPWQRSGIAPIDAPARAAIAAAGLSETSVAPDGQWVPLRRIESTEAGGVDEDVTRSIHPDNLAAALAAAELFGLGMAGIDIITEDIAQPWHRSGAIINEVNYAPLLGGAEISRSNIPGFLREFIEGDGTIPVEVFAGGTAAWAAAQVRWQAMREAGLAAWLSSGERTLAPDGEAWRTPLRGLHARARALVLSARVAAIVLVVQTDELLAAGLPLEAVSSVTVVDDRLSPAKAEPSLPPERIAAALQQLRGWPTRGQVAPGAGDPGAGSRAAPGATMPAASAGSVAERFKAPVLKTGDGSSRP